MRKLRTKLNIYKQKNPQMITYNPIITLENYKLRIYRHYNVLHV